MSRLNTVSSILLFLIPTALLTGPFLPDLFASIISIFFLISAYKRKQFQYFKNFFVYIFLIFYLYLVLSALLSDYPTHSISSIIFYFRFGLFALAIWFLIDNQKNFFKYFLYSLLFSFLLVICDGFYQYFNNENLLGIVSYVPNRMTLTFNDKLFLGGYIVRLFPILIALILLSRNRRNYFYLFIAFLIIIIDTLVYLSGERTAIGLLFVSTVYIILLVSKFKYLRLITFFISIFIIAIITINDPNLKSRNIDHTLNQIGITEDINESKEIDTTKKTSSIIKGLFNDKIYLLSRHHEILISTSYRIFIDNPILGAGPNNFKILCHNKNYLDEYKDCSTHPHNLYFQILAELGIIGFLFILFILFILVYKSVIHLLKIIKKEAYFSDYQICILSCFLMIFFPMLPSQDFFNNYINIFYYIPVGLFLHTIYGNKEKLIIIK